MTQESTGVWFIYSQRENPAAAILMWQVSLFFLKKKNQREKCCFYLLFCLQWMSFSLHDWLWSVGLSTAARTQTLSTSEPGKNQIQTEPQEPDSGGPGRTALYWGLGLTAAAAAVGFMLFYFLIIHPRLEKSMYLKRRVKLRGNFSSDDVEQTIAL